MRIIIIIIINIIIIIIFRNKNVYLCHSYWFTGAESQGYTQQYYIVYIENWPILALIYLLIYFLEGAQCAVTVVKGLGAVMLAKGYRFCL